jgi:hypothetical protein
MSILRAQFPIPAARALEAQLADLRDQVFELADTARQSVPHDYAALHVSLQIASNELGEAERLLREASPLQATAG